MRVYKPKSKTKIWPKKSSGQAVPASKVESSRLQQQKLIKVTSCILILGCLISLLSIYKPIHVPVSSIRVSGKLHYLDRAEVRDAIAAEVTKGFFSLDVNGIKQSLEAKPWLQQVNVRRAWPNKLNIRLVEHQPQAIWNMQSVISQGELLHPDLSRLDISVPLLSGPEDKYRAVWQKYLGLREILSPIQVKISSLQLAARGAWELHLDNGIKIILGTHEIEQRLKRFVTAYDKILNKKQDKIDYVDMRYTSGMAVGWKSA